MVTWLTDIDDDSKALFSIAATPKCMGGCYSLPCIALLTFDTYLIKLSVKEGGIKYQFFLVFRMTRPGIEPWTPELLVNIIIYIYIYIYI